MDFGASGVATACAVAMLGLMAAVRGDLPERQAIAAQEGMSFLSGAVVPQLAQRQTDSAKGPSGSPCKDPAWSLGGIEKTEELIGLAPDAAKSLLGAPAKEETNSSAVVWSYLGCRCVLKIYFYSHIDGGKLRALAYEVTGSDEDRVSSQHCFQKLPDN
jgi:hypothetical protein